MQGWNGCHGDKLTGCPTASPAAHPGSQAFHGGSWNISQELSMPGALYSPFSENQEAQGLGQAVCLLPAQLYGETALPAHGGNLPSRP